MKHPYVGKKVIVINTVIESEYYKYGDIFTVSEVKEMFRNNVLKMTNGYMLLESEVNFIGE